MEAAFCFSEPRLALKNALGAAPVASRARVS